MQSAAITRILGLLLMILSFTFIPPMLVEAWYKDGDVSCFMLSFGTIFSLGAILWALFRASKNDLRMHDGFLLVVLFWLTAGFVGAMPLYIAFKPYLSLTNAFFESVSGFTTTGSTIFTQLDSLPHSILYYRQQLQFLGGISIIVLAVAIMPTLGIGGMQLFRTEMTGPTKDDKVLPRITESAKAIWFVYLTISVLCAICYYLAGMTWFDAIGHSFSTVSTGGFSTHDASLAYFNSPAIQLIAVAFMIMGAINFNLHYLAFKRAGLKPYTEDAEFSFFIKLYAAVVILIWVALVLLSPNDQPLSTMINSLFETASFISTSGFASANIVPWPIFIPILLLFLGMVGGCAGSTSGGFKIIRVLLLQKQATREVRRLVHPHGQYVVKFGQKPLSPRIIEAIWGFFAIYFVVFVLLFLLMLTVESDFLTAYSALIAALSNSGRGLGTVVNNFAGLSDGAKWLLSIAMLVGRLEIFTVLVILSPVFWRR
jgi:trk system potassium uptake protein